MDVQQILIHEHRIWRSLIADPRMQADFVGLGVITLDALMRREWVKEDELAEEIKVHPKVLRRVLRYLEQVR